MDLGQRLHENMRGKTPPVGLCSYCDFAAGAIYADRQAHIDALVEAGVLERTDNGWWSEGPLPHGSQPAYRVLPPHVHEWYAQGREARPGLLAVSCLGCSEDREVPNRLPIEVPDA